MKYFLRQEQKVDDGDDDNKIMKMIKMMVGVIVKNDDGDKTTYVLWKRFGCDFKNFINANHVSKEEVGNNEWNQKKSHI